MKKMKRNHFFHFSTGDGDRRKVLILPNNISMEEMKKAIFSKFSINEKEYEILDFENNFLNKVKYLEIYQFSLIIIIGIFILEK